MRFLVMVKYEENGTPPPSVFLEALAGFREAAVAAGAMIDCGGLQPSAMGSRLRLSSGRISMTDGPFAETKELIGGFSIFEAESKDDVIAWHSRFLDLQKYWTEWECEVEIRQIQDEPHFGELDQSTSNSSE